MASTGSWPSAPKEAFIVGLKELPESEDPVIHRHIFYAHAYKVGPWLFYMRIKPFILQHQYMCSWYCYLYISYKQNMKNLFNNQEPLEMETVYCLFSRLWYTVRRNEMLVTICSNCNTNSIIDQWAPSQIRILESFPGV